MRSARQTVVHGPSDTLQTPIYDGCAAGRSLAAVATGSALFCSRCREAAIEPEGVAAYLKSLEVLADLSQPGGSGYVMGPRMPVSA